MLTPVPKDPYRPATLDAFEGEGYAYRTWRPWRMQIKGIFRMAGNFDQLSQLIHEHTLQFTGFIYGRRHSTVETIPVKINGIRQKEEGNVIYFRGVGDETK